ncbi:MAG: hypothetical protein AUG51_20345 [Acidobacteria bacterium 13_1_20CM_3_53_8]|nr:MAG: hypothetical protein AUG51_20345 [Acidobacteria bacterium 13_1_20CM_3_53_8]
MARTKKRVLVIISLVVALFVVELVREEMVYLYTGWFLQHTYWQVRPGMTKEQVRQLVGEPESVVHAEDGEHWVWSAANHRGLLFKTLRLASPNGHYELVVTFDDQNRTSDVFAGSS